MKKQFFKKLIFLSFVLLLINNVCLAEERVLIVTGDSYAQHFYEDEKNNGVRLDVYALEGRTVEANLSIIMDSLNDKSRYALLAISVNDAINKTPIDKFKRELRQIFDRAMNMHKVVFVHSYVEFNFDGNAPNLVFPNAYDEALKEVSSEYMNVFYLDMSRFLAPDFFGEDTIHANRLFNDALFSYIYLGLMPYLESQTIK